MLAGAVILVTRKTTASKRYSLLIAVYGLFITAVALTFFRELGWTKAVTAPATGLPVPMGTVFIDGGGAPADLSLTEGFGSRFIAFVTHNAGIIVALWSLLFFIQLARMASGLRYVKEVKRQGTLAVTGEWSGWMEEASRRLGIRQCVALFQSERIQVPVALGFLKPVVLVPVGLLTNLDKHQVEAVLLHELAHIRRHDYLVNLLQSFADAVFAFHPAVHWLSARIREARESCCDETAVCCTGDKKGYVEALVSFSESSLLPSCAMAIGGNKMHLLNRVKTIITRENNRLSAKEQVILVLGLMTMISFAAFSFKPKEDRIKREPASGKKPASVEAKSAAVSLRTKPVVNTILFPHPTPAPDTVPSPFTKRTEPIKWKSMHTNITDDGEGKTTQVIATEEDGTVYRLRKAGDEMVLLSVNGREIPKEDYAKYYSVIDAIEQARRQRETAALRAQEQRTATLQRQQQLLIQKLAGNSAKRAEALQEQQMLATHELSALKERTKALQEQQQAYMFYHADSLNRQKQAYKAYQAYRMDSLNQLNLLRAYEQKEKDYQQQAEDYYKKEQQYSQALESRNESKKLFNRNKNLHSNRDVSAIIADLLTNGLAESETKLSFSLTAAELVVNGKPADKSLFEIFRKKYIRNNGDSFQYFRDGGTTRTTVNLQ